MQPPTPATLAKHGITEAQWRELWDRQGGKCAICRRPPKTRLVIDHDHRSGLVRGLLCPFTCNGRLGKVRDDIGWLESAAEYLREPVAQQLGIVGNSRAPGTRRRRRRKVG